MRLGIVEEVLEEPPEEDGEGEQHEDARHKPGGEGGFGVLSEQLPHQERETHKQDEQVEDGH